ncbi:uncharacterized protein LOC143634184 [Bidens hawaiensis]|uniref:uncharacterized protein LOC143634184 n=1 Tax=Bidens hawaiensis TaxID=980011 RepID=UPI00404B3A8B
MKAYRAKMLAREHIIGNFRGQYGLLRDYIEELKRTNPDTTVKLDLEECSDPTSETRQFKRIYISVALDPNNGYYPVAYAVVEAETLNSWQKGIIQAVDKLFHSAEHRFCVRHIEDNLRSLFKGKLLRDALWKLARCTSPTQYEREMNNLKNLNKRCHLWVSKIPPETWSRSHFSGRAMFDVLTNNMCECFNSKLVDGRDKPIITLLEYIREYVMRKIVTVLKVIDRSSGLLTPYATQIMESVNKEASRYYVHWNGEDHYQVTGPYGDQCVVNMSTSTCACRRWEITGIPCRHVVACIWVKGAHDRSVGRPETFVKPIYTMDRWKAVYSYKVYPINGMSMWPTSQVPIQITAPKLKKQTGRPKKSRKKSAVEREDGGSRKKSKVDAKGKGKAVEGEGQKVKAVRKTKPKGSNTCGTCGQKGHNKRSCMKNLAD